MRSNNSILKLIVADKPIIAASIVLCLAAIFIFSFREYGQARETADSRAEMEFVIQDQENLIQPADQTDSADITRTEAIIYERSMSQKASCGLSEIIALQPSFSDDLSEKNINLPILMYHYIEAPGDTPMPWLYHSPEVFEAQLKTLASECYSAVFASEAAKAIEGFASLPGKPIAITFDDGYADMYAEAYPLLKKYNMKGTMYVIVNALDKPGYLTKAQAKEMAESGLVEIASHTFNHANLKQSGADKARYEIAASKPALEAVIGKTVESFAYPYGFFTARDEEICRQAGYSSCASTYPGQVQSYGERFSLYRLRPGYRVGPALINWLESAGPKR